MSKTHRGMLPNRTTPFWSHTSMTVSTDPLPPPSEVPQSILNVDSRDICDTPVPLNDPPPPYPSQHRRPRAPRSGRRINIQRILTSPHQQFPSDSQQERLSPTSPALHTDEDFVEPTETTLLLTPSISRRVGGRPRSYSHASTVSAAPSLAQTVFSLFQTEDEPYLTDDQEERSYLASQEEQRHDGTESRRSTGFFSIAAWRRYFRPLGRKAYYSSLLHLVVINFPYALAAWLYLFVFTVVSTLSSCWSTLSEGV